MKKTALSLTKYYQKRSIYTYTHTDDTHTQTHALTHIHVLLKSKDFKHLDTAAPFFPTGEDVALPVTGQSWIFVNIPLNESK